MTRLYKDFSVQTIVPAIPFRPAMTVQAPTSLCGAYPRAAYQAVFDQLNPTPASRAEAEAALAGLLSFDLLVSTATARSGELQHTYFAEGGAPLYGDYAYVCTSFDLPQALPATSTVEGSHVNHIGLGWDTGAISTTPFLSDGFCTFSVKPGRRYAVGLCRADARAGDFNGITHGVLIDGQTVSTLEDGVPGRLFAWPVSESTVFKVQRLQGVVTYSIAGRIFATTTDVDQTARFINMSACVYDGGGWVDGLSVTPFATGASSLTLLASKGGVTSQNKSGAIAAKLPNLTAQAARWRVSQYGARPSLTALRGKGSGAMRLNGSAARVPRMFSMGGVTALATYQGANAEFPSLTITRGLYSAQFKSGAGAVGPLLVTTGSGTGSWTNATLPHLQARGGNSTAGAASEGVGPAFLAHGGRNPGPLIHTGSAASSTPSLVLRGGRILSGAAATTKALTLRGGNTPFAVLDAYNHAFSELPAATSIGYGKTGTVGHSSGVLHPLIARGMTPLKAGAISSTPALAAYGFGMAEGEESMFSPGFMEMPLTALVDLVVVMNSAGVITSVMGATLLQDGAVSTAITGSTGLTLQFLLNAVMQTSINAAADTPLLFGSGGGSGGGGSATEDSQVWVVNLSNNATSTFENYAFNSFAKIGGRYFGLKADGLYLLEGDTDDTLPIRASVSFGKQDFGTPSKKNMTRAYVGGSSTGALLLKIITGDGTEYIYAARDAAAFLRQQRFDVGRGLQSNYFTFELFNQEGCDFELDTVEFFAADFSRRI